VPPETHSAPPETHDTTFQHARYHLEFLEELAGWEVVDVWGAEVDRRQLGYLVKVDSGHTSMEKKIYLKIIRFRKIKEKKTWST
jgi:hypothetical protein